MAEDTTDFRHPNQPQPPLLPPPPTPFQTQVSTPPPFFPPPPFPPPSRQPLSPVFVALISGVAGALIAGAVFAGISLINSNKTTPLTVGGVANSGAYAQAPSANAGVMPNTNVGAPRMTSTYTPAAIPTTTTMPLKTGLPPGAPTTEVPIHGEFSFKSTSGDYIGGGATVDYKTPAYPVSVTGTLGAVHVSAGGWTLDLAAPKGYQLTPGTNYLGATRYPFNTGPAPGLSVSGNGRGCNQDFGSFTIKSVTSGPDGSITGLDATFTQTCESKTAPALTGFVKYSG